MSLVKANGAGEVSTGFYNGIATQSARFDANHYMTQSAPSSAGDRRQFTFSWWAKKSNTAEYATLYSNLLSGSNSNSTFFLIYLDGSASTVVAGGIDYAVVSTAKLRDTSNWYHCVLVVDTDQASNDNRMKIYINGILGSSMSGTCPQTDLPVNNTQAYQIGRRMINNDRYMDAYIADFHLIDGTAVSDTSRTNPSTGATEYVIDEFGEFKNGVWIPKAYSGSYGTNGFRLEFKETGTSANSSGIGADTSGNTHHFTPVSMVASDSNLPDSPENNFATLDINIGAGQKASATYSEGNLKYTSTDAYDTAIGTIGVASGKWYFEARRNSNGYQTIGLRQDPHTQKSTYLGQNSANSGIMYSSFVSKVYNATAGTTDVFSTSSGDIMQVAFDADNGYVWFGANNTFNGTVDSSSGRFTLDGFVSGKYLFPAFGYRNSQTVNFGQDSSFAGEETAQNNTDGNGHGDFYYAPPSGYLALCNANLPDTGFNADESNQPTAFHNVVIYSGTGNTTQNITGVGFQPDWVWIKNRNTTVNHYVLDSTRGLKDLHSNTTDAQGDSTNRFNSFDSDGFQVEHTGGGNGFTNGSGQTYVAWNWKINGGTTTTDTTGTQDSIIQTNQTLGMTIGTHEATSGTYTFAHGLGATPEFLMFRNIDGSDNWVYWHTGMAAAGTTLQYINSTVANSNSGSAWLSTLNSTLIGITTGQVSGTSGTHLFWAFRSIEGFSKFGSYEGNANADGPLIHTGFRPSLIWIKNYDTGSTDHLIYDDTRHKSSNSGNPREYHLITNSTDDTQDLYDIDFLSNGFKIRHGDVNNINAGDTYLYWAWAHNPFKFSNAF
tara:strand:+ start:14 stop:2506 length:2493 start_codon:yes stop_codon:yes gene_type:complete